MGRIDENTSQPSAPRDGSERRRELRDAHRAHKTRRHRSLLLTWMTRLLRRPRRPHIAPLPTVEPGQIGISFAGHASVLVRYANRNIVCDPMLGRWVKGIKRAVMPGFTPADLHDVDTILITHAHVDHLHRPTLAALPKSATVIVPPRTAQHVSDLGFARVVELSAEQSIQDHGVDITTVSAHHGGSDIPALAYVIRGPGPSVFFCGDSGYFPGFAEVGARFAPDIAILPIGGYSPLSFRERHMSPLDALYALEDLGARVMIPIHHGAFTLSYERLDEPMRWLSELIEERRLEDFVVALEPGQSRVFVPPRSQRAHDPLAPGGQPTGSEHAKPSRHDEADAAPVSAPAASPPEPGPSASSTERARIALHVLPDTRAAARIQTTPWSSDPPWAAAFEHRRVPFEAGVPESSGSIPIELESGPVTHDLDIGDTQPAVATAEPEAVESRAALEALDRLLEDNFLADQIDSLLADESAEEPSAGDPLDATGAPDVPDVLPQAVPEIVRDQPSGARADSRLHVAAALF